MWQAQHVVTLWGLLDAVDAAAVLRGRRSTWWLSEGLFDAVDTVNAVDAVAVSRAGAALGDSWRAA